MHGRHRHKPRDFPLSSAAPFLFFSFPLRLLLLFSSLLTLFFSFPFLFFFSYDYYSTITSTPAITILSLLSHLI